ncbi:MAG: hypothetical protein CSA22_03340 [Deltaproteobacteria bacterium]|nr:MAG: hypothetical protein CSA22_03340 [Deltaproteobacteria bacterium]
MKMISRMLLSAILSVMLVAGTVFAEDSWTDMLTLSGCVEFELGYENVEPDGGDAEKSTDMALATAELGVDAAVTDNLGGFILFSYGDDEDVVVDEATITISGDSGLYLTVGKLYVPFGKFETAMLSGPLTQDLGEARETAFVVGYEANGLYASFFGFNGDVDEVGEDSNVDNFGANVGYAMESDSMSLDAGVCYTNNLADSDAWGDGLAEAGLMLKEYVSGFGGHVILSAAGFTLIGEYVGAMDDPEFTDGMIEFEGDAPSAWNAEIDYTAELSGMETTFGLAFQGSENGGDMLPETKMLGVISAGIMDNTALTFEAAQAQFENDDETTTLTLQLALEF